MSADPAILASQEILLLHVHRAGCPACPRVPCPACKGDGIVPCRCGHCGDAHEQDCADCAGDGEVVTSDDGARCPACREAARRIAALTALYVTRPRCGRRERLMLTAEECCP